MGCPGGGGHEQDPLYSLPIWELSWEFPGWDLSHFAKFGIFMGIL